jgi:hypothetical protein
MTATPQPETRSPSRRALLAGALGGLGALVASAIGRASPARAGVDGDVILGFSNIETGTTAITNSTNGLPAFEAEGTAGGTGVHGISNSNKGVWGESNSSYGVLGGSTSSYGVYGSNASGSKAAIVGNSVYDSTGVLGFSGGVTPPASKEKTGVYGYAVQDAASKGVWGDSTSGTGVNGVSTSGTGVNGVSTSGSGVYGTSGSGVGVEGVSSDVVGVYGHSTSGYGVQGGSGTSLGVYGASSSSAGVKGYSTAAAGVFGVSGSGPGSIPNVTGVYGYALGTTARGVIGETNTGHGVHGIATTGFAGYFAGKVYTTAYHEMQEISAPSAPAANHARLFLRDNGGFTQLCVRFNTGGVKVLATQT